MRNKSKRNILDKFNRDNIDEIEINVKDLTFTFKTENYISFSYGYYDAYVKSKNWESYIELEINAKNFEIINIDYPYYYREVKKLELPKSIKSKIKKYYKKIDWKKIKVESGLIEEEKQIKKESKNFFNKEKKDEI